MAEKIVQTAGRNQLGEFAPMFAHLNDDVLFGEVWNEEAIDIKTKCIITVVSLMASGITDSSLTYHLQNAKAHGVTKEEIPVFNVTFEPGCRCAVPTAPQARRTCTVTILASALCEMQTTAEQDLLQQVKGLCRRKQVGRS